ncbi:MAG: TIGR00159 family protein [Bacteroidetes bacterium]|nr:MAG: TIGR00159 family protein [Bacteroidota bacterium]RLD93618.1 MAG: TIGR00159 family protein [Bacteroidota bacterium]RLE05873.1 MAG: TIGR00159 family protein [Bacteroidota bacterium]
MLSAFIHIRLLDIIDIILVALLFYQLYMLIRGTVAFSITMGIAVIYIFWWIVRAMQMELLSTILGSVLGVGVIALIIVFQQEIRRFLIFIGSRYVEGNRISVEKILNLRLESKPQVKVRSIMKAVMQFSLDKTGALIVIRRRSNLDMYAETGDVLNAETSSRLFVSIFNKTSPLHDGAVIVENDKVKAARVILPVTEKMDLPPEYGLRHRAGLGISEVTDSLVIIVSEETGQISMAENGILQKNIPSRLLRLKLEEDFD